jgi:hypothetical protein
MISIKIKSLLGLSAVVFSLLFLHFSAFSADPAASKAASAVQSEKMKPLQFEATVIGVRGSAASMSTGVTIWLEATTSDEDLHEYLNLIAEKQAQGYTSQLRQRLERVSGLGRIAITGKTGTELAVVRRRQTEEGELFTLVTARNLPFVELRHGGRTTDYPFSFVQLLVDEEGKGQGTVIVAARVMFDDDGQLEIESYGLQPFQLVNVRRW